LDTYLSLVDTNPATPKDRLRTVIDQQPDDSSFEEILRELAFVAMVERGLADAQAGRTVSHDEMRKTLESWRK
jgi:predicted transcriptional regulator